jgi:hypothetical protein
VALLTAFLLTGCGGTSVASPPAVMTTPSPTTTPPCVESPDLLAATDTFLAAAGAGSTVPVNGAPGGRRSNLFDHLETSDLAAMTNPLGRGVIVSVVYGNGKAFARDTAQRVGWLILDGSVYPMDVEASQAFGLLWDGVADEVRQAAGVGEDFGLDAYGLTDFVSFNADSTVRFRSFLDEANRLCATPTVWG